MTQRYVALVPAAGIGARMKSDRPKQYLPLCGKPLMWHTLTALSQLALIDQVALILSPDDGWFDDFQWAMPKLSIYRVGGATRAESVYRGLLSLALADTDWVMVHDAARCCLSRPLLERFIAQIACDPVGGLLALPVSDTVKRADTQDRVMATLPRTDLWLAQTPQMFRAATLEQALLNIPFDSATDEASAIESLGLAPRLVEGEASNLKVTWPHDLALAQAILHAHSALTYDSEREDTVPSLG